MPGKSEENKILSRRFDLVKKMYFSDKVVAANKKDLIFNWFLEQFGNFDNDKKSGCINELLWKTFHEILETEKQNSSHRILIKSNVVTNLLNAVANYSFSHSWASIILSSVALFLETPTVNATLIADIDTLYLLLIAALKVICKANESNCDDGKSLKEAKNLCCVILNILENLSASNEEEKILLLSGSLQDLALFFYIAKNDQELDNLSERLAKKIIAIVFNMKSKQYETLLTPIDVSVPAERPNTSILQFLLSLHNMLMNEDPIINSIPVNETCAALLKKLLTVFLLQNKFTLHSFKIMSLLFAVAGLDVPITVTSKTCCNSLFKEHISKSDVLIVGLSHVLEACLTVPQHLTSLVVPEGYFKPSEWLQGVSAALLNAKIGKNKSSWLKCFHSMVLISPPILENVLPLIKTALLNITVRSAESKKQYCELFDVVLKAHSKRHQVPRFFVKLLLALTECIKEDCGGKFLINGQILPQVQESIARCVQELPHGQMISLWEIFIQTFSSLEEMSQVFSVSKGCIFFVAQIFSTFLLHAQLFQANIPSNIYSQFSRLIKKTSEEIKKNVFSLKEKGSKIVPLQKSVLLLCYAIGEVKLAYRAYYGKSPEKSENLISRDVFDFSLLHSFLDEEYVFELKTLMDSEDKLFSVLIFQLLLQKIKALQFKEVVSDEDKTQLKGSISIILNHLRESCTCCEHWDMDICSITTKNYGTVYWKMFLKVSPLILNHLDANDFQDLCISIQSVIFQGSSSDTGAKSIILDSLKSDHFHESQMFQTAFVSVIWKQENFPYSKKRSHDDMISDRSSINEIFRLLNAYDSKAAKYSKRTPKCNKKLGNIWNEIKEISEYLNSILLSQSLLKEKLIINRAHDFIKLLDCLPLDYLLPGNQMKCIIGLSLLFFLVPQSCKSTEAASLAKEISSALVSIFEGVRSIWLFDFVSSGPYLRYIVKTINSVFNVESNDDLEWAVNLTDHLISLIVKNVESLNAAEQFISELNKENECTRITLMIYCALLKKLSQVVSRPHKQEKYKESLIRISSSASQGFIKLMKSNFKAEIDNNDHACFIKCYICVIEIICNSTEVAEISSECFEPFSTILQVALNKITSSSNDFLNDIYLLFISKICKYAAKLSEFLPKDFIPVSWKIILSYFEKKREKKKESLTAIESFELAHTESNALSSNSCMFCSSFTKKEVVLTTNENSCTAADSENEALSSLTLSEFEKESLKELSAITNNEKLAEVFEDIFSKLSKPETDVFSLQMSILVFQNLIDADNTKFQHPLLNQLIQAFLCQMSFIANQACSSSVCQLMVRIPVLDLMSFVVKENINLPKPVLLQSLHCVAPVPLDVYKKDYSLYVKLFIATWNHVYNLFMHHYAFILHSPAPFLSYVAKLLKSIVSAGAADSISKCDSNIIQQVQLCAQNMNRLLTVIARHKNEFSKLVPYLIADYVDAVQHITLDSNIKESILSGIHRLLDICSEDSIKMQAINISYVCREIYGNLVKNYKQNKHISVT